MSCNHYGIRATEIVKMTKILPHCRKKEKFSQLKVQNCLAGGWLPAPSLV